MLWRFFCFKIIVIILMGTVLFSIFVSKTTTQNISNILLNVNKFCFKLHPPRFDDCESTIVAIVCLAEAHLYICIQRHIAWIFFIWFAVRPTIFNRSMQQLFVLINILKCCKTEFSMSKSYYSCCWYLVYKHGVPAKCLYIAFGKWIFSLWATKSK